MGDVTGIQWTHATFNPWIGCQRVSAECDNCYADVGSRRLGAQHGLKLWDEGSSRYFTGEGYWDKPLAWNRAAEKAGERRRVFCASYADVFERRDELVPRRRRLFELTERTPWLDWLLLTKRPENIRDMLPPHWRVARGEAFGVRTGMPRNVWLGTTVGVRSSLARLDALLAVDAAVHFVSIEPQLEDLGDLSPWLLGRFDHCPDETDDPETDECLGCPAVPGDGDYCGAVRGPRLDWVIQGGESGPRARPFHLAWARSIQDQCKAAGVAYFCKQLGARPVFTDDERDLNVVETYAMKLDVAGEEHHIPSQGELEAGAVIPLRDRHGGNWNEWPEDLRIRQFPAVQPC